MIDLASATPPEIYEAVKAMDSDEFDRLMEEPESRDLITRALVDHMAGLFRPDKARDLEAVVHVKLWDKPGGGYDHFEMRIENGTCVISDEPGDNARMTLKIRPSDLRAMLAGETGPRRLAMRRKLTVLGDLKLGARLPDLFAF
ncbi:MAG TPA: SCP2 sterol-binding domain-containing protein [Solirubrobacterales bacterium]|nr:SCP2 sterol-binding domain-containing protein [Solirubrobacterales bacterium]